MNTMIQTISGRIPQHLRKPLRIALSTLIGAAAGYAMYVFIGCPGGACPITGNPLNSVLYGAAMGLIVSIT